jgi:hypothetical protein
MPDKSISHNRLEAAIDHLEAPPSPRGDYATREFVLGVGRRRARQSRC